MRSIKALPVGGTTKDRNDDGFADNVLHAEAGFTFDEGGLETTFDVITPSFGTGFDGAAALIALINDPGNLLAGPFGFTKREYFELDAAAERAAPKVSFS